MDFAHFIGSYGMDDQEEVSCFIDRNLKVIIPIQRMDYIEILYPMEQKAKKIVQESELESHEACQELENERLRGK